MRAHLAVFQVRTYACMYMLASTWTRSRYRTIRSRCYTAQPELPDRAWLPRLTMLPWLTSPTQ
eukprot:1736025-Amphidinium_carterae.1